MAAMVLAEHFYVGSRFSFHFVKETVTVFVTQQNRMQL